MDFALLRLRLNTLRLLRRRALDRPPELTGKRLLFIAGLHRSGTSALHDILRRHPRVSGIHGTRVPQDEGQFLQRALPIGLDFGGPGRFGYFPAAHMTEASPAAGAATRDRLLRDWGAYWDLSKDVFIEKSPPNLIRSRLLQALFPEAEFIFIVRHPLAVALATQKWSGTTLVELLHHWNVVHHLMLEDVAYLNKYSVIRYEDMAQDIHAMLRRLGARHDLAGLEVAHGFRDENAKYLDQWSAMPASARDLIAALYRGPDNAIRRLGYRFESETSSVEPPGDDVATGVATGARERP
jgi:hypothetical protein